MRADGNDLVDRPPADQSPFKVKNEKSPLGAVVLVNESIHREARDRGLVAAMLFLINTVQARHEFRKPMRAGVVVD